MIKEYWKPVVGYEGLYMVSNWGRVKSMNYNHSGKERIMKLHPNDRGYLYVELWKNNKRKTFRVHRLVAEAFLPNPYNLPMINHRDENKSNNNVNNLEWCDCKYNNTYGTRIERCSKPVVQYTLDGQFVKVWKGAKQAEREGGFSLKGISMCCKGKQKYHKGFIWKYL